MTGIQVYIKVRYLKHPELQGMKKKDEIMSLHTVAPDPILMIL